MIRRRVCVVTGSRADYGLLYWPMKELEQEESFDLQIIATGTHLSPEFGFTMEAIEKDGFKVNSKVEMLLSSDTSVGVSKSLGLGIIGFADALALLKPDILILLGDRYEVLAAAQAALVARIPVAHICGGDVTEGAIDEAIRHSITKMSHLHFVTNSLARERVIKMGENPDHVFNVGSPGLDFIRKAKLLDRGQLEKEINFSFREKNFLVTFHPETLEETSSSVHLSELLNALSSFDDRFGIIFTKSNSDTGGRAVSKRIEDFVRSRPFTKVVPSLGQLKYLSAMAQADVVIGNSSSGLYEAPSFKKPTVNIGNRQKGRLQAASVITCPAKENEIKELINKALEMNCNETVNPYGDGKASERIRESLKGISNYASLLKKRFF